MQYIYTMKGLGKVHPPDAVVLKDIWLSFLPGAKIGVLGLNGAGKSSLLKIMSGEDTEFVGEAFPADGISVGFLPQEPRLNPAKSVKGNVEEGVAATKALLDRYDELNMKLGEDLSPEQMDKVLEEQGRLQDKIDAVNAWDIDSQLELAMDALRCPQPDADVNTLSGGEPIAADLAGFAAARRADQPPRRRVGGVAGALPRRIQGHGRRGDARPLLP
jgi:ATPase subunit of ABC transporter with duplicated ATPase domains